MTDLTFIHLTDLHLAPQKDDFGAAQNLHCIIDRIQAMEIQPDFFIMSGDLSNHGEPESYERLKKLLLELENFGVPVLLGLGNHDKRRPFRQVILREDETDEAKPYYYSTMIGDVRVIMLDSKVPERTQGTLDETQLTWLGQVLASPALGGNLIVLHHPPTIGSVTFLNEYGLSNHECLAEVLAGHQILGILSGHIHYPNISLFHGILSQTSPAIAFVIDPGVQDNLRGLVGCGFSIGNIRQGQLLVTPMMLSYTQEELFYHKV